MSTNLMSAEFSCKIQLVSFVASCLGEPDMFGDISAHSVVDFFDFIAEDAIASNGLLLKDVIDELEKQSYLQTVSFYFVRVVADS